MGLPAPDVDVAVARDSEGIARELEARGLGRTVLLSEESPRVVRVAGSASLDLADLVGDSIEADLARRDFTANALAIDLSTGDWLDPFGGAADIARHRLRRVREENLAEDPLRAFRAARFFATHGLRPDRDTEKACRRVAPALRTVAPERIATELGKLLSAATVAPAFRWAARTRLLPPALDLDAPTAPAGGGSPTGAARCERSAGSPAEVRRIVRLAAIADAAGLSSGPARHWLSKRRFVPPGGLRRGAASGAASPRLAGSPPAGPPGPGSTTRARWRRRPECSSRPSAPAAGPSPSA